MYSIKYYLDQIFNSLTKSNIDEAELNLEVKKEFEKMIDREFRD
jgi:hypothetical protein